MFDKALLILALLTPWSFSIAMKMQQSFDNASAQYKDINQTLMQKNKTANVKPADYTKGDVNKVDAKNYYDNELAMDTAKQQHFQRDASAQSVMTTNDTNKATIDGNNPAYKTAAGHQANADKILSDNGERYACVEVRGKGSQKTHSETCQVSNVVPMQCIRYPEVKIIDVPYQAPAQFNGNLAKYGQYSYGVILPESGTINSISINFWHEGHNSFFCHTTYNAYINGQHFGSYRNNHCSNLCYHLPFAKSGLSVAAKAGVATKITFGGGGLDENLNRHIYKVNMTVTRYRKEAKVTWKDTCQNINKNACVKTKEQCVEPGGTRNIGGVNVTQECWKYDIAYTCGYKKHDNCDDIARRCNFVSQKCIEEAHGYCYAYERTYQCSEAVEGAKELVCGNPNSIQFTQVIEQGSQADFLNAVAALAGANEMGESLKKAQSEISMLKGQGNDCGEGAMGVYDCCDGGGNFLHGCSDQEKALQKARQKKIATFTGRYCGKKVLGVCVAHRQGWCVFDSKLARILQEQGRAKQLGIGFGSGEHPNCTGMTPEQLQKLDFRKIDFSEFFEDIKTKVTLPNKSLATSMDNKFKSGETLPDINRHQNDKRAGK